MLILTTEQMKHLENISANMGVDHMRLMENAGSIAAKKINDTTSLENKNVVILCGKGNNGGDSAVVARKLIGQCKKISLIVVSSIPSTKQAYDMFERLVGTSVEILQCDFDQSTAFTRIINADIIIDGIFGTGFKGQLTGKIADIITACNNAKMSCGCKFSLDIPSGIEGDTGVCANNCFKADYTIVFGAYKLAQFTSPADLYFGEVLFADIAIPKGAMDVCKYTAKITDTEYFKAKFPLRDKIANKGDFGKVLNIAGCKEMTGAAYLSTISCLRSGAGLVCLASSEYVCQTLGSKLIENTFLPLKENENGFISSSNIPLILKRCENATAITIGCGLGLCSDTKQIVYSLIIDADGINAISENINILKTAKAKIIITPHPGEMARLLKKDIKYVRQNRIKVAQEFAVEYGVCVVLKGHGSVICSPDGTMHISNKGGPVLAKGGSGDVLTGIIGAFISQGLSLFDRAALGVYVHGMTGDICANQFGVCSVIARDIIDMLKTVFKQLNR
ncbi:MAG: NAD(P)H-hydrate dehydratase [Oscillospiraceae bacterium]